MSGKGLTGIINYGAGNLGSVVNALKRLSIPARFVRGPEELNAAHSPFEKLIFPGDGHFAAAVHSLESSGFARAIKEWISADKPFLGICIGLQLLFETSEETAAEKDASIKSAMPRGLSVIQGAVKKFPGRKVPQIGWNQTAARPGSKIFRGLPENSFFYYIHSYYCEPADSSICAARAEYYLRYCSAVERGALAAVQFHPEKSGEAGLALLKNWAG